MIMPCVGLITTTTIRFLNFSNRADLKFWRSWQLALHCSFSSSSVTQRSGSASAVCVLHVTCLGLESCSARLVTCDYKPGGLDQVSG